MTTRARAELESACSVCSGPTNESHRGITASHHLSSTHHTQMKYLCSKWWGTSTYQLPHYGTLRLWESQDETRCSSLFLVSPVKRVPQIRGDKFTFKVAPNTCLGAHLPKKIVKLPTLPIPDCFLMLCQMMVEAKIGLAYYWFCMRNNSDCSEPG